MFPLIYIISSPCGRLSFKTIPTRDSMARRKWQDESVLVLKQRKPVIKSPPNRRCGVPVTTENSLALHPFTFKNRFTMRSMSTVLIIAANNESFP